MGTFVVGIDLGTTHTVVAWSEPHPGAEPHVLELPQLVGPAEWAPRALLSSTLYAPAADEPLSDPLGDGCWIVGEHARRRGAEVPARAVGSAKSWLCHSGVDRTAPILPWRAAADDTEDWPQLSPVSASMRLLRHVGRAWDAAHPQAVLAEQDVTLTVPASFDAVARQLTVSAAEEAGLHVRLLEEPQAAFYAFMQRGGEAALESLLPDGATTATVLVCDVGGGTTDLSLIRVERCAAPERFVVERVAVGRHLLLGGDNMDLALAYRCERRLVPVGEQLGPTRFAQLVMAARVAKERLFADPSLESVPIAIARGGARLVGATLRTELTRSEVLELVLEGFFPVVALGDAKPAVRAGIVAFGLPYERDVAITRHLAAFLLRHLEHARPDALLLNGGVFRAQALVDRLAQTVAGWLPDRVLRILPLREPEVAVARGAVAYGLALRGYGTRIGGGSACGYYLGVGRDDAQQVTRAVCVLPRGAGEGVRLRAEGRRLELTVGRPVRFELYATETGVHDEPGEIVEIDSARFERLPPLVTALGGAADGPSAAEADGAPGSRSPAVGRRGAQTPQAAMAVEVVPVWLEAELSAVGTLDLSCVEASGGAPPRRFALAFELRGTGSLLDGASATPPVLGAESRRAAGAGRSEGKAGGGSTFAGGGRATPEGALLRYGKRYQEACAAIELVFGKGRADVPEREVKGLVRTLERILGPRPTWTAELARALYDLLARHHRARRRSVDHERIFWSLAGFCLRPGFGDARDSERVSGFAKLFEQGLVFPAEARSWPQFWIAWRRVAAGLDEQRQTRIRDIIDPFLATSDHRLKKPKLFRNDAVADMLDLAASLEHVPATRRRQLGSWVLERTWTERDPRLWTALGRIGARVPAYGSVHQVVAPNAVERWVDHLLRERWEGIATAPRAAVSMCRLTNDRARDLAPATRQRVAQRLEELGVPVAQWRPVLELVAETEEDRVAFYGEDLPVGLRLADADR